MNNSYPPFSVLMSLYIKEQARFLHKCLESLARQTLKADEIVIVLDGPITKKLQDTLNNWRFDLPLKLLPQEHNQGLGIALNIGLKECSYEYVFRMDTDDICLESRFEKQLDYMLSHPKIDILGCYVEEFSKAPYDIKQIKKAPPAKKVESYIKLRNPINHMGVLYKKNKILSIGGYKDLPFMEDYYLWIRAYANNLLIDNLQEPLVHARIGNGMLERRQGKTYHNSEKLLHKLRIKHLKMSHLKSWFIFALRSGSRATPSILRLIYKLLRYKIF